MHICFLDGHYPDRNGLSGGGAGWYIKTIGGKHIIDGHIVTVIKSTPNNFINNYIDNNGIRVIHYRTSSRFLTYLSRFPFFAFLIRPLEWIIHSWTAYKTIHIQNLKKKIDIIETVDGGNIWLSISKLIPFIEHVHCSQFTIKNQCELPIDLGTRIERKLQLISLRRAFAVISPSNAMLQIVENENRKKLKYKKQIPLCLNRGTAIQNNKNKTTRFIFASRNDALKGGNTLLKAIESANKEIEKKATFYFIGYEPCPNKEYPSNIIFKPFMPRNELLGFYPQCDVALLPSLFDNSPLFIYESMAAGLPVIATNVGGIPELIEHAKTGYLFEMGDDKKLASFILDLIRDPVNREYMSENAQKFIRNYASLEKIAGQKMNLYNTVIMDSRNK